MHFHQGRRLLAGAWYFPTTKKLCLESSRINHAIWHGVFGVHLCLFGNKYSIWFCLCFKSRYGTCMDLGLIFENQKADDQIKVSEFINLNHQETEVLLWSVTFSTFPNNFWQIIRPFICIKFLPFITVVTGFLVILGFYSRRRNPFSVCCSANFNYCSYHYHWNK